jgi:hypothetical protein
MTLFVAPIVEGQTEQGCVERLLHRVWSELFSCSERLQVLEAFRGKRDILVDATKDELSRAVQQAQIKLRQQARNEPLARTLVLVLLDAEDDCPAELGPGLLETARKAWVGADVTCVIARRMLESWMVAGVTPAALGGVNGLPADVQAPPNPEDRNGVRWLGEQIRHAAANRKYAKPVDGPTFIARMDLGQCRRLTPSFDKLCRELERRRPADGP